MKQYALLIIIPFCLFSCNYNNESSSNKNEDSSSNLKEKKEPTEYYAWVDKLRVRKDSNMNKKNKTISSLDEGEKIFYTGIKTKAIFEAKLRGRNMRAPLFKIKTSNDKIGWVFAGALSIMPVNVENYKVALFFDETFSKVDTKYISNAMDELIGSGIDVIYVDGKYDEVNIKNSHEKIIGVEDISKKVKKYHNGVICVEKGRSQHYIPYSQNVSFEILENFGIEYYEGCSQ